MLNYDDPDYFDKWLARDCVNKYIFKYKDYDCDRYVIDLSSTEAWKQFDNISSFIQKEYKKLSFYSIRLDTNRSNFHAKDGEIYSFLIFILKISQNSQRIHIYLSFSMHYIMFSNLLYILNPNQVRSFILYESKIDLTDEAISKMTHFINQCTQLVLFHVQFGEVYNNNHFKLYETITKKETISEIFIDDTKLENKKDINTIFDMIMKSNHVTIFKILKHRISYDFKPEEKRDELAMKHDMLFKKRIIEMFNTNKTINHFELYGPFCHLSNASDSHFILLKSIFEALQNNNVIKKLIIPVMCIYNKNVKIISTLCINVLQYHNATLELFKIQKERFITQPAYLSKLLVDLKPFLERNKYNNIRRQKTLFMTMLDNINLSETNKKQRIN